MKKKVTVFILSILMFYLLVSFVVWNLDASMWDIKLRAMFAFAAPLLSLGIAVAPDFDSI